QHEGSRERRVGRREPPRLIGKQRLDGPVECAPRVNRSDADVHGNCADRDAPAVRGRHGAHCNEILMRFASTLDAMRIVVSILLTLWPGVAAAQATAPPDDPSTPPPFAFADF